MKKAILASIVLSCLTLGRALAADQPRGSLLELHSCELFAGGCIVSSEATLDGRYMLRAWNFTGGSFSGADLAGLQLAVLESSAQNLASADAASDSGVIYLPQSATARQRKALLAWLKTSQPGFQTVRFQTRVVPMQFGSTAQGYTFSAGDAVAVRTAALDFCDAGACGESLWYNPRATTTIFTVARDGASRISEPLLKLHWDDAGKRSVFLAKFGEDNRSRNLYVTSSSDLCGPTGKLF